MSSPDERSELELDEDIKHQQKVWQIERFSRVIMGLLILAALLGLLGHGPLSKNTLSDPASGMVLQYQRFERANSVTFFKIHLNPADQSDTETRLLIGRQFLDAVELVRIEPPPTEVELGANHNTYVFRRPAPGNTADLVLHYKPRDAGPVEVELGLEGHPVKTFSQFIYP